MEQFKSFITEEKDEPYKLVVFNHHGEAVRDVDKEEGLIKFSPKYWEMYLNLKKEITNGNKIHQREYF